MSAERITALENKTNALGQRIKHLEKRLDQLGDERDDEPVTEGTPVRNPATARERGGGR